MRTKYSEQFEFDAISNTLGMEKSALASQSEEGGGIITLITSIDWRYQMWKVGITMTDNVRKPQFYIQLVNRPHFGTGILLFGQSGPMRTLELVQPFFTSFEF